MSTTAPRATDIEVLDAVQRRVLWLATSIVHHANRVRRTPSGVKRLKSAGVKLMLAPPSRSARSIGPKKPER